MRSSHVQPPKTRQRDKFSFPRETGRAIASIGGKVGSLHKLAEADALANQTCDRAADEL